MNVSLTPALEKYVRRKVASGLYNNASEVVREALRLLLEREQAPSRKPAKKSSTDKERVFAELAALKESLRSRGIGSLAVFGSFATGKARSDSDVDVLVDTVPGIQFSLVDLVAIKNLLEDHLGRAVDVVTKNGLEPLVRDRVLREAQAVF